MDQSLNLRGWNRASEHFEVMSLVFLNKCGFFPFHVINKIVDLTIKSEFDYISFGKSSFAKRRRAKVMGRCHRCYRVSPRFYFTRRCDGITCVPGINSRVDIEFAIKTGRVSRS